MAGNKKDPVAGARFCDGLVLEVSQAILVHHVAQILSWLQRLEVLGGGGAEGGVVMPQLQHKLAFRQVLKYQLDVTLMEESEDDVDELELLVILKVGDQGALTTESRVENRSGPVKVPDDLARPGKFVLGQSLPDFLPALPEREVNEGDAWTVDGAFYELTSVKGDVAEIVSRKVVESPRSEVEWLFEFDFKQGRVVLAQSVLETQLPKGRSTRRLCEYELQD